MATVSRVPKISLRLVLIAINLVVLVLPVAGIVLMRLYESALVRQTESALIAQAAFVAAFYRAQVLDVGTQDWLSLSRDVAVVDPLWQDGNWVPRAPQLDLATSPTLPPFPQSVVETPPHQFAVEVGKRLEPVMKDAQLTTLAGIRVVDPWGIIVASTGEDVGQSIAHGEEIRLALEGRSVSRIRTKTDVYDESTLSSISRTARIRVFVAAPILLHDRLVGAVMLSRTPPSILQALGAKRWLLLQAVLAMVVLVLFMSLLTFRLIAKPIARLADQAGQIADGELTATETLLSSESRKPRTVEIARLQEAITAMAGTLESRAAYLQEFSRHVSHEFKTPIASIRGAIEVLQDHGDEMSEAQRLRFLSNIEDDAERLHRLTQRLMDLTQAEMGSETNAGTKASLSLGRLTESLANDTHGVALDIDAVDPGAEIACNANALEAVLEILIENAAQHGATHVKLSTPAPHSLAIEDNGRGISHNNAENIFEPFFTTVREQGGTGLGLAIASALLNQSNATIALTRPAEPTVFTITFARD